MKNKFLSSLWGQSQNLTWQEEIQESGETYRHENKYLISYHDQDSLRRRLSPVLALDKHVKGDGYTIRSLYFDDYWQSAYEEKDAGVLMRKKYRIRIYNFQDHYIRLERKKKFGAYIYKESAPLTRAQVEDILLGHYDFLKHSPHSLAREFYIECVTNMMRPRVIVDYEREPWILDAGTVRVTFDTDVRAAVGSFDIFDAKLPTLPVLPPDKLILEVKYTELMPQVVRQLVPTGALEYTAVSKYVLCYEKTAYKHGFNYWFDHEHF